MTLNEKIEELMPKNLFSGDFREEVEWRLREIARWTYETLNQGKTPSKSVTDNEYVEGCITGWNSYNRALQANATQAGITEE